MPQQSLTTTYRGARLELRVCLKVPGASLHINGLQRDAVEAATSKTLRLTSTVQTDYEWHEFIEGIVTFGASGVDATILANKAEIVTQSWPADGA